MLIHFFQAPLEDISDVVDKDAAAVEGEALHNLMGKMLPSSIFKGLIILLITANGIIIGIQTDERMVRIFIAL